MHRILPRRQAKDLPAQSAGERAVFLITLLPALLVNAVLCVYLCEMVARRARSSVVVWYLNCPDLFWGAVGIMFCLTLFLTALTDRPARAIRLTNFSLLFLAAANMYKRQLRGEPLLLTDFGQAKEAAEILPNFHLTMPSYLALTILVLIVLVPLLYRKRRLGLRRRTRVLASLVLAAVTLVVGWKALHIHFHVSYQYDIMYDEGGFVRGLWETRAKNLLKKPDDYSRETVGALLDDYAARPIQAGAVKPDVFFIMSESLFDLYRLKDLQMSADPLESLKALQASWAGADYLSPNLGGGTFYSEYEVLTGYRALDTPGTLFNDHSATREGMETVGTVFRDAGYTTTAMHPHGSTYYNRAFNYERFGFQRMLFNDTGLPKITERIGRYPKDRPLFELLLADLAAREGEGPQFYHVVTYQNHGSYNYSNYDRRDIRVANRTETRLLAAENYINGSLEHMEAVEYLLSELEKRNRPTVVVLWGDHAPNVGEFGIEFGKGLAAGPFYKTPMFIWNNYGADFTIGEPAIAAYRLGAIVLDRLGFRTDAYLNWLAKSGEPDLLTAQHALEKDGRFIIDDAQYDAIDQKMLLLHYDRLKGEAYWKEAAQP